MGLCLADREGTIRVDIGSRADFATVEVSDTGRGIPPQNLTNIFHPFFTTKGNGTWSNASRISSIWSMIAPMVLDGPFTRA
jgi:K+-sensing histidine kinase KdpD